MKKIKKLLLAFAPLTAIAISTPIVLTACSDTTTNNTNPGEDNGNNGGNNNQKPMTPSIQKDSTNSAEFMPDQNSKAKEILDKYIAAKGQVAAEKVLTDELSSFPKVDSSTLANDVLNMWSNNNWFALTKNANDSKVKDTFVSNLTITKAEVVEEGGKPKATFDVKYESGFVDSNGKVYEAIQLLKADKVEVDSTTAIKITKEIPNNSYKIDGKDQPLSSASLVETVADPKTNLENNLKQKEITLDAKQIFTTFITNHSIKHGEEVVLNAPIWNKTEIDKNKTYLSIDSSNSKLLVFDITKASGNNIFGNLNKETHIYEDVKKVLDAKTTEIVNLITTNDYKTPNKTKMMLGMEQKDGTTAYADVTISFDKMDNKDGNDTKPTLTFRFKGFKAAKA